MAGSYACAHVALITVWIVSLPVRKYGSYINLETCQIAVVCSVKHFMASTN